jgi:hypothetical protein
MMIHDARNEFEIRTVEDLEAALGRRYEHAANSFWLHHEHADYPVMLTLVVRDLAFIHFIPAEFEPGFTSVGDVKGMDPRATTVFYMRGDPEYINNDTIIPFDKALEAAKEFFENRELPSCLEWNEL